MAQFIKNIPKVIGNIKKLEKGVPLLAAAALYQEALIEQKESMKRTPVDTGTLRNSHETSAPYWKGKFLNVDIQVGGPAASYAVVVHEDLEAFHRHGEAKFLENTIKESAPYMLARIAKRMKLNQGMV
jgi:hypothetical protein